ncbi:MAG TPA: GatB/YqeY domain-containing protein [Gammaproteobacteria bacterium]|nr:GatB/YqeY domain-containing protein [Gammaproteobacteria bacterium]
MDVKSHLETDLKAALKARDVARVSAIRLALAAVKQREIDSGHREGLDQAEALGVIERLIKQRHEAAVQYRAAGRDASAAGEEAEAKLLSAYLPEPIDSEALDAEIRSVIREAGAGGRRDMGKVMGLLKARLAGRADMAEVSRRVREQLSH